VRTAGRWLVRRLVLAPLVPVLLVLGAVSLVVAVLGGALVAAAGLAVRGVRARWRPARLLCFAVVYLLAETVGLVCCLGLWLGTGFGWQLRAGWSVRAHRRLLAGFLGAVLATARAVFGFRLEVTEPAQHPADMRRTEQPVPLLVLARHAGPGASFALVHLLIARYHRDVKVVLSDQLRLDPGIDLLLSRTGCVWVPLRRREGDDPAAMVGRVAAGLRDREALVLFPEGADWTPLRHVQAVARLRQRGLLAEARRALRLPHVLPPRPAGTLAALAAAPGADVLVFTHTGHDELLDAASTWAALPLRVPLQMTWWRAPRAELPEPDEQSVADWLQRTWADIDAWIDEQQQLRAARG
jgi:1-acyl-sn-glycerol-3-phosphate acyltransferase